MRVAVFGGSFDPPHMGHVLAVAYALASGFERVVAPVVFEHAFAKPLTPFPHRVRMLQLALRPMPSAEVSSIEQSLPSPSFTVHTLEALQSANPHWAMRLVIGSDVLHEIDRWRDPQRVTQLAPPFVLGRAGHAHPAAPGVQLPKVSSSELRSQLTAAWSPQGKLDRSNLIEQIPAATLDYIEQQALYR